MEFLEQEEPPRPEYEAKCIYERKNPVTGVNPAQTFIPAGVVCPGQNTGLCFTSILTQQNNKKKSIKKDYYLIYYLEIPVVKLFFAI